MDSEEWVIHPLNPNDSAWVEAWVTGQWAAPVVVAHGQIYSPAQLPGFAALSGGERIGLLTYTLKDGDCEIVTLNSTRDKRGVGTALMEAAEAAEAAARQSSCRRVWLVTSNDNLDALRFYQKRGYRLVRVDPGAVDRSRLLKPEIPLTGDYGIPIRDEIELEKILGE